MEEEEEEEGDALEKGFLFGLSTLCEKEWVVRKKESWKRIHRLSRSQVGLRQLSDAQLFHFLRFHAAKMENNTSVRRNSKPPRTRGAKTEGWNANAPLA